MRIGYTIIALAWALSGCKKDDAVPNPFDDPANKKPAVVIPPDNFTRYSIQGLHKYIFSVKCANAGCHDGNFEPDFRTIESSWNTLVYHPVSQKGDSLGFTYRVVPGDTSGSFMHERITKDVNNLPGSPNYGEGIMPLYSSLTTAEIGYIERWIMEGAKDIFDSSAVIPNAEPQMLGVTAYRTGVAVPLPRQAGLGPIIIPASYTSVDLWISFIDDVTSPVSFSYNKIRFSIAMNDFSSSVENAMTIDAANPVTEPGFYGNPPGYYPANVVHYHKITFNPNAYGLPGETVYFRVYVRDADHSSPTEIPEYDANYTVKKYFAYQIN